MAGPALSRRLGTILGTRTVSPEERETVRQAAFKAEVWADLPAKVQELVREIQARPGWVTAAKEK